MRVFVSCLFLITALTACASGEAYKAAPRNEAKIGNVYSNTVRIGAVVAPMPPGRWELISWRDWSTGSNYIVHNVMFAKHDGKQISEILMIRANDATTPSGWAPSKVCQAADDYHYLRVVSYGGFGSEQLCWGVVHSVWTQTFHGPVEKNRADMVSWAHRQGLQPFRFGIAKIFVASRRDFIRVSHIISPTTKGFPDRDYGPWRGHPWSKANIPQGSPAHHFVLDQVRDAIKWWPTFKSTNY